MSAPLPPGPFDVIYADPPWSYTHGHQPGVNPAEYYDVMTTDDIQALPVAGVCATDAVLYLWATAPLLPEALSVIEAWGFAYKSGAVWVKTNGKGMGYWWRVKHEHLLVGVRGKPRPPDVKVRRGSVIDAPVTRHSEKPHGVRRWIAAAFPGTRRLELFARHAAPGWTAWGNGDRQGLLL